MTTTDERRWENIVECELLGDPVSADDAAFRASFEAQNAECADETERWQELVARLQRPGTNAVSSEQLTEAVLHAAAASDQRDRGRHRTRSLVAVVTTLAAAGLVAAWWLGSDRARDVVPVAVAEPTAPAENYLGRVEELQAGWVVRPLAHTALPD